MKIFTITKKLNINDIYKLFSITNVFHFTTIISLLLLLSGDVHPNPGPVNNKHFSFSHINSRSLTTPNRISEIKDFIGNLHEFDIVGISETHLDSSIKDSLISIPNYKILRKDRNRRSGGVCLYIKEHISCVRKYDLEYVGTESI